MLMKNIKEMLVIFPIFLFVVVGCGSNLVTIEIPGGYPFLSGSVDRLILDSTHIVMAKILDSSADSSLSDEVVRVDGEEWPMPYTIYRLRILEVYMGNVEEGDIIEVAEIGGRVGNREVICTWQIPLTYGDVLIFFLGSWNVQQPLSFRYPRETIYWPAQRPRQPLSFRYPRETIYWPAPPGSSPDVVLMNYSTWNNLVLTVGDLERIAKESGLRPPPAP